MAGHEVVILRTFGEARDEKLSNMTIFPFHWDDRRTSFAEVTPPQKYFFEDLDPGLTWEEAQLLCMEWGGGLANITSTQEDDFVRYVLKKG